MSFEKVLTLGELEIGTAAQVEVGGEPICLVRTGPDEVKAVHDVCSHQYYELHEGWVEDGHIECALHGSSFDLESGAPDALPAVKPIPTYAVRIDGEDVLVDATSPANDATPARH